MVPLAEARSIFQQHWWLDVVARGHWEETIVRSGDSTVACYPYVLTKICGLTISRMPPFTNTLGPAFAIAEGKPQTRLMKEVSLVAQLLRRLPRVAALKHIVDHRFANPIAFLSEGFQVGVQPTILFNNDAPLEATWSGLRDKTRNLIRRAQERLVVVEVNDPDVFTAFYMNNLKSMRLRNTDTFHHFPIFAQLFDACTSRQQGRVLALVDETERWHAAAFFVWDCWSLHYLLATRDPENGDLGALSLLYWEGIRHAKQLGVAFIEGVSSRARWRFLMGFGGEIKKRLVVQNQPNLAIASILAARIAIKSRRWSDRSNFRTL
jgi:Acetyltransferase (GNAT) domain